MVSYFSFMLRISYLYNFIGPRITDVALPTKNIKVINSFYKGMHDMQRCLRL